MEHVIIYQNEQSNETNRNLDTPYSFYWDKP